MARSRVHPAPHGRDPPRPRRSSAQPHKSSHHDIISKIAECDRKLAQHRAALDAGADSDTVAASIAETEAEKASYALAASKPEPRRRRTEQEIKALVDKFADVARVLIHADPDDKAEIFRKSGLKLTYHPARYLLKAQAEAAPH